MDTRSLSVFLCVAETLSFSRSGEQLHMSVSSVSRTIRRLEDELGQPLLTRDNRSVRLTGAGREFREYARRSVAQWQQLRRKLGSDTELAGEVSLYCSVTASYRVLAPILEAFRSTHPAVEIMMHTGDQADGVTRVLAGQDDVAVSGRPGQLPRRLEFLPLLESPLRLWGPTADCAVRQQVLAGQRAWIHPVPVSTGRAFLLLCLSEALRKIYWIAGCVIGVFVPGYMPRWRDMRRLWPWWGWGWG